jgi:hypothetical protein
LLPLLADLPAVVLTPSYRQQLAIGGGGSFFWREKVVARGHALHRAPEMGGITATYQRASCSWTQLQFALASTNHAVLRSMIGPFRGCARRWIRRRRQQRPPAGPYAFGRIRHGKHRSIKIYLQTLLHHTRLQRRLIELIHWFLPVVVVGRVGERSCFCGLSALSSYLLE